MSHFLSDVTRQKIITRREDTDRTELDSLLCLPHSIPTSLRCAVAVRLPLLTSSGPIHNEFLELDTAFVPKSQKQARMTLHEQQQEEEDRLLKQFGDDDNDETDADDNDDEDSKRRRVGERLDFLTVWCGEHDGGITIRDPISGTILDRIARKEMPNAMAAAMLTPQHRASTIPRSFSSNASYVFCLATPKVDTVWAGLSDGMVRVYSTSTTHLLAEFRAHTSSVLSMHVVSMPSSDTGFEHHMHVVLTSSLDWSIAKWDATTMDNLGRLTGHSSAVKCLGATQDGNWCVAGGDDGSIRCWSLLTNAELRRSPVYEPHNNNSSTLEGHDSIEIQQMIQWPLTKAHQGSVTAVLPLYNRFVLSCSHDGMVRLWSMKGEWIRDVERRSCGVTTLLHDVAGLRVLIGGIDGRISVYSDLPHLQPITVLGDHSGAYLAAMVPLEHRVLHRWWTLDADGQVLFGAEDLNLNRPVDQSQLMTMVKSKTGSNKAAAGATTPFSRRSRMRDDLNDDDFLIKSSSPARSNRLSPDMRARGGAVPMGPEGDEDLDDTPLLNVPHGDDEQDAVEELNQLRAHMVQSYAELKASREAVAIAEAEERIRKQRSVLKLGDATRDRHRSLYYIQQWIYQKKEVAVRDIRCLWLEQRNTARFVATRFWRWLLWVRQVTNTRFRSVLSKTVLSLKQIHVKTRCSLQLREGLQAKRLMVNQLRPGWQSLQAMSHRVFLHQMFVKWWLYLLSQRKVHSSAVLKDAKQRVLADIRQWRHESEQKEALRAEWLSKSRVVIADQLARLHENTLCRRYYDLWMRWRERCRLRQRAKAFLDDSVLGLRAPQGALSLRHDISLALRYYFKWRQYTNECRLQIAIDARGDLEAELAMWDNIMKEATLYSKDDVMREIAEEEEKERRRREELARLEDLQMRLVDDVANAKAELVAACHHWVDRIGGDDLRSKVAAAFTYIKGRGISTHRDFATIEEARKECIPMPLKAPPKKEEPPQAAVKPKASSSPVRKVSVGGGSPAAVRKPAGLVKSKAPPPPLSVEEAFPKVLQSLRVALVALNKEIEQEEATAAAAEGGVAEADEGAASSSPRVPTARRPSSYSLLLASTLNGAGGADLLSSSTMLTGSLRGGASSVLSPLHRRKNTDAFDRALQANIFTRDELTGELRTVYDWQLPPSMIENAKKRQLRESASHLRRLVVLWDCLQTKQDEATASAAATAQFLTSLPTRSGARTKAAGASSPPPPLVPSVLDDATYREILCNVAVLFQLATYDFSFSTQEYLSGEGRDAQSPPSQLPAPSGSSRSSPPLPRRGSPPVVQARKQSVSPPSTLLRKNLSQQPAIQPGRPAAAAPQQHRPATAADNRNNGVDEDEDAATPRPNTADSLPQQQQRSQTQSAAVRTGSTASVAASASGSSPTAAVRASGAKKVPHPFLGLRVAMQPRTTGRPALQVAHVQEYYNPLGDSEDSITTTTSDLEEGETQTTVGARLPGPAAAGGLEVGDELVRFAGYAVTDLPAFNAVVARHSRVGAVLPVTYRRNGQQSTTTIVVGSRVS